MSCSIYYKPGALDISQMRKDSKSPIFFNFGPIQRHGTRRTPEKTKWAWNGKGEICFQPDCLLELRLVSASVRTVLVVIPRFSDFQVHFSKFLFASLSLIAIFRLLDIFLFLVRRVGIVFFFPFLLLFLFLPFFLVIVVILLLVLFCILRPAFFCLSFLPPRPRPRPAFSSLVSTLSLAAAQRCRAPRTHP